MRFDWIAGTGGIGKGEIFKLVGNATLGREESRSAFLTDYRDYCKQHIILSYPARLFGNGVSVYACGRVGKDARGENLIREMREQGFCTDFVKSTDAPTKYSVCFLYENGEGGNITSCNDACSFVTEHELTDALKQIVKRHGAKGIVLAAPEVPLKARIGFLHQAKRLGCLTVCTVLAGEAAEFLGACGGADCDIIALNADETAAMEANENIDRVLRRQNPSISIIATKGKDGCDVYLSEGVYGFQAAAATAVSTAGAGDALLGGVITGLASGVPLVSEDGPCAMALGILLASFAVESPHTIPNRLSRLEIMERAKREGLKILL